MKQKLPWSEKYRAFSFLEIRGQDLAIEKTKKFLKSFPKKKSLILHGPPGTGKTSLAYAIAFELDAEILELNASDLRNREKIESIIKPASEQKSLFKKNKIILLDEVDGISSRDRGGLQELLEIISYTNFPVIITANDIWDKKFSSLRQKSELVQLKEIDYKVIAEILKRICEKEKCQVKTETVTSIAIKSKGDIRAALNDLQILSENDSKELLTEIGDRNKEQSIFSALQYIFKNSKIDTKMLEIFDEVNMTIDEIFLWVEENIPLEYKNTEEIANAFDALSKADVFRGRIYKQQHWRFLVYEYFLLGAGIASAKKINKTDWTQYKPPARILKIWLQNQRAMKKKSICQKYAQYCHISSKQAMKEFLLIKIILKSIAIQKQLKLSDEEIEYLNKNE